MPKYTHDMVRKYLEGNVAEATKMQLDVIDLIECLFCEVNPIPVKKATELMGMTNGVVRLPLTEMEPQNTEKLVKAMKEYGIQF